MDSANFDIVLYADGSYASETGHGGGVGGWAWYVNDDVCASGRVSRTTSNRMEITAVLEGLTAMSKHFPDKSVLVVSDSAYVVDTLSKGWYEKWRSKDWQLSSKKAVKNVDLWKAVVRLWEDDSAKLTICHVKGHGKATAETAHLSAGNAVADLLANDARSGKCVAFKPHDDDESVLRPPVSLIPTSGKFIARPRPVSAVKLLWENWNEVCEVVGDFEDGQRGVYLDEAGNWSDTGAFGDRIGFLLQEEPPIVVAEGDWLVRENSGFVTYFTDDEFRANYDFFRD